MIDEMDWIELRVVHVIYLTAIGGGTEGTELPTPAAPKRCRTAVTKFPLYMRREGLSLGLAVDCCGIL